MANAAIFFINGFEEIEALTSVDVLRRGGVDVETVSLESTHQVTGKHRVEIKADRLLAGLDEPKYDILIIPGGTLAYLEHRPFMDLIAARGQAGRKLAAICAAPAVLGRLGLLKGKKAVCYPGLEGELTWANVPTDPPAVITDGTITTSRGPSTALVFALEVLKIITSPEQSLAVAKDMLAA
ncbi:MAG: DJ-1/PfpI family protein [Deltaproteobacteria bacterium]|jgi:4-methyl-5(b-hydroxyethyl)-thiazole monophosphate biosynthesis|nr:DJ-1/PfpI family protein [Deltaproteobacteria bacterium]